MSLEPDGWSTHQEALVWAATHTFGPMVELGGGFYSTALLHALSDGGREIVTIEADQAWVEALRAWETAWHRIVWDPAVTFPKTHHLPGLVFVDHDTDPPGRAASIRAALAIGAQLVVIHDTQPEVAGEYPGMAEAMAEARYRRDWTHFRAQTSVISNRVEL